MDLLALKSPQNQLAVAMDLQETPRHEKTEYPSESQVDFVFLP